MKTLEGVKVIDLAHAVSGPTCTYTLGLLGAEIIKIERPGVGDSLRQYTEHAGKAGMAIPFAAINAGKESLTLDIKTPQGHEVLMRLIKDADVLVENFRPGVSARLGIGYETLKAVNPRLIHAAISGFGQSGVFRDWPAYDHIVQAMSGLARLNETRDGPLKIGVPLLDSFSGFVAALAIMAGLYKRRTSGVGESIDVAMLDSAFKLYGGVVSTYFYTGVPPAPAGNRGYRLVPTSAFFRTSDGWIALGANNQHQVEAFCRAMNCPEFLQDERFVDHASRVANFDAVRAWLSDFFSTKRAAEVEAALTAVQVPAAMIRSVGEIAEDPHWRERDFFLEASMPDTDKTLKVVGAGYLSSNETFEAGHVPALGEDTEAILARLGYDAAAIQAMKDGGVV